MSSYASIFAVEKEYRVKGVLNPGQVDFLRHFFETDLFATILPNLADVQPDWEAKNWIVSYP